jgi:ADP-heptose:LPS heptosyltransferase
MRIDPSGFARQDAPVPPKRLPTPTIRRIAILTLTGLGETLLYLPALRELRRRLPDASIDAVCASRAARELLEQCPEIRRVVQVSASRATGPANAWSLVAGALRLRRERYDLSLPVFPANRLACTVLAAGIGARWRLTHRYAARDHRRTGAWLLEADVPADPSLHDVEQNLALVYHALGDDPARARRGPAQEDDIRFEPGMGARREAEQRFHAWNMADKRVIGFHVTSFPDMTYKRWDGARFRELMLRLLRKSPTGLVVFGTPDERDYIEGVVGDLADAVRICTDAAFPTMAALVGRCAAFVSNDSGLMHVAVSMGVPTLGIFGPTNPTRTRPYGPRHRIVQPDHPCVACYRYPFGPSPGLANCRRDSCLRALSVDEVHAAFQALQTDGTP